jgi:hypothetical protein
MDDPPVDLLTLQERKKLFHWVNIILVPLDMNLMCKAKAVTTKLLKSNMEKLTFN